MDPSCMLEYQKKLQSTLAENFPNQLNPRVNGLLLCFYFLFKKGPMLWSHFFLHIFYAQYFLLESGAFSMQDLQKYVFLVFYFRNQLFQINYFVVELLVFNFNKFYPSQQIFNLGCQTNLTPLQYFWGCKLVLDWCCSYWEL